MPNATRRTFLKSGTGLLGLGILSDFLPPKETKPLLSFSTLGCPKWSYEKILQAAHDNGYDGIEIRGILGEVNLPKCAEFSSKEAVRKTRKMAEDKQVRFAGLGSSANMHVMDPGKRKQQMDEGRRFIDLAAELGCPNVRVFPNQLPKDQDREATIQLIIEGLLELGDHAKGSQVHVLLESHGEVVGASLLKRIMEGAKHPNTGLVWDIHNMWSVTRESPAEVYPQLKPYIRHTHIKDAIEQDGKLKYVLLGKGESPIFDAIDILYKDGYPGYYSFEWEKLWHPEIDEPEIAIPDYPVKMKDHFSHLKV